MVSPDYTVYLGMSDRNGRVEEDGKYIIFVLKWLVKTLDGDDVEEKEHFLNPEARDIYLEELKFSDQVHSIKRSHGAVSTDSKILRFAKR